MLMMAAQKKDEDEDDITDEHLDDAFDENLGKLSAPGFSL